MSFNFSDDFMDGDSRRVKFDIEDTQPIKTIHRSTLEDTQPNMPKVVHLPNPELEDTKPHQLIRPANAFETVSPKPKFNWVAFFVMILSIGAALLVGYLIPGPFDEFLATVVISSIYGFLNANNFRVKNIFRR